MDVDLPVDRRDEVRVTMWLVADRSVAVDRQPREAKRDVAFNPRTFVIRSTVMKPTQTLSQPRGCTGTTEQDDATHGVPPSVRVRQRDGERCRCPLVCGCPSKLFPNLHEKMAETVLAGAVSTVAPVRVVPRMLDEEPIARVQ